MKFKLHFLVLIFLIFSKIGSIEAATCNWSSRYPYFLTWDSCSTTKSLYGYIAFKSTNSGCYKYQWSVNGTSVTTNRAMKFTYSSNGTYKITLKVTDTCNSCDTTFSSTISVTCVKTTCNWASRKLYYATWDSCAKNKTMYGYFGGGYTGMGCFKYQWTINGVNAGTTRMMKYTYTSNGTYKISLKVSDTCSNCDTTYSSYVSVSCINTSKCNWGSRKPYFLAWDSCASNQTIYGYMYFANSTLNVGCLKYNWTVNGSAAGTSKAMTYKVKSNGTYTVSCKVTDSCNSCDTTFTKNISITCFSSSSKCNWASRKLYYATWDSCAKNKTMYGYFGGGYTGMGCFKYQWTINGVNAGTTRMMKYTYTSNGTYKIALKVSDTCNNCDTTYNSYVSVSCINTSKCNWASRKPYFLAWDSCSKNQTLYGYIYFGSTSNVGCLKYVWTVNGAYAGNTRPMTYKMSSNGSYVVNCKVTDTCSNCDTTFSKTLTISCFSSKGCNWASRTPYFMAWDSCSTNQNIYGYIGFNYSKSSCFKYQWSVNGLAVTNSRMMKKVIYSNGYYYVSCKVTDTCNNCDTTFSKVLSIGCLGTNSVNQLVAKNNLKVYPNPSKNEVHLEWNGKNTEFNVYDLRGQLVFKGALNFGINQFEFQLPSGMYFIKTTLEPLQSVKLLIE